MEKYIVKPEDLKEKIKDFPLEVVQRMVDCHIEQYGKIDIEDIILTSVMPTGLFEWSKTKEGHKFWNDVINHENFDLFFKKYPKDGVHDNKEEKRKNGNLLVLSFFSTILFSLLLFVCLNTEYVSKYYNVVIIKIIHVMFITLAIIVSASVLYKNIKEIYANKNK